MSKTLRVAIAQAEPVLNDLPATMEKTLALARQAAADGAQLVCFGETWLAGYPAWLDHCPEAALWNHAPVKELFARMRANAVVVPGPETEALAALAGELRIGLVVGANERAGNTLYNALLLFDERGRLANHHRKLVPTYSERMVWGCGDGHGLAPAPVHSVRTGGLVCWEHWMPLARQHMHAGGEQVHVAVWPTVHEMHQVASRHYAFEGRCFVLAAGQILHAGQLPLPSGKPQEELVLRGGSAVYAPDGRAVAGPVFDRETVVHAMLDLAEIDREAMTLDVAGHYARPDVFEAAFRPGPPRA